MEIDDGRTDKYIAKMENEELKINLIDVLTIIDSKDILELNFKMIAFASKEVIEIFSQIKNPNSVEVRKD